jgi:hypothetical protein
LLRTALLRPFGGFFSFRSPAMQLKKATKRTQNRQFSLQSKKLKRLQLLVNTNSLKYTKILLEFLV